MGESKSVLAPELLAALDNCARALASRLREATSEDDPAVPSARVLYALVQAVRADDAETLREMGDEAHRYLKRRRQRAEDPNWPYQDPWADRTDDAETLLGAIHVGRRRLFAERVDEATEEWSLRLAKTFAWELYYARGVIHAQLRHGTPEGQAVTTDGVLYNREAEAIKPIASAYFKLRGRDLDDESYVRAGLVALGYPKEQAEGLFRFKRQQEARAEKRRDSPTE